MMRAMMLESPRSPLVLRERPLPAPGAGQILIAVAARRRSLPNEQGLILRVGNSFPATSFVPTSLPEELELPERSAIRPPQRKTPPKRGFLARDV
jgi:hypothetical protein